MAYGENPMNAFVALVMQGQAKAKGQAAAKDLLEKQTKDAEKSEVSFKGDGTVVLKGAADQLLSNTTPDRQVQDAYDEPVNAVNAKLAGMGQRKVPAAAPAPEAPQSELGALHSQLESYGITPRSKQAARPEDVDTYREGYQASRELGQNPLLAAVDGLRVMAGRRLKGSFGSVDPTRAADQLNRQRVAEDSQFYLKFIAPAKGSMANDRERNEPDRVRPTNFATMVNSIDASEYETVEEYLAALPELTGISQEQFPPGARGIALAAMNKQKKQTAKQKEETRRATLGMFLDKLELGQYDSFDRVKARMDASTNVTWNPEDYETVRVEWKEKRDDYLNSKAERERAEKRFIDAQTPKPDRPTGQWSDEDLLISDDPKAKKLLNSRAQAIDEQIASAKRKITSLDARKKTYEAEWAAESQKKGWLDTTEAEGYRGRAQQMAAEREALESHIESLMERKARLKPSAAAREIEGPPAPGQAPPAKGGAKWRRL